MELGALIPLGDIGGDPAVVRDYAQAVEAMGYDFLEAPDHVLGVNAASRPDWDLSRNTSQDLFHDPFVLFGFLAGCTSRLGFSTGVLILPQRQTVLVAKQAACLDVLCDGRFRLGIGVGWNEVEFLGLNENFRNRGRRSEEQVQVMQALWAQDHVAFKGRYHALDVFEKLRALTRAAGRDPKAVGIEVWTSCGSGTPADWRKEVAFWKSAGASHIALTTTFNRRHHRRIAGKTP